LLDSDIISNSEVTHAAELIINYISDLITSYRKNPALLSQQYAFLNPVKDYSKLSRKELIDLIGIDNLSLRAK